MVGFLMKTKSPYSIADAVNNLQRLDQSYLAWADFERHSESGDHHRAHGSRRQAAVRRRTLKQVLAFARTQYDWSVLDLGRNLNADTLSMLDMVDETYLVTTHEVPALHQAKQIIQVLLDSGYSQRASAVGAESHSQAVST